MKMTMNEWPSRELVKNSKRNISTISPPRAELVRPYSNNTSPISKLISLENYTMEGTEIIIGTEFKALRQDLTVQLRMRLV
mmetsp:Transcript_27335/g.50390  ORF Transcript_27335/g.50390 Transcript_27335/m.50390 type:complete len:81 (+) Transcript_27335:94-336(+)